MFPYKTNSPDYLDYVASALTREEILANPDLCVLLENEYIKDNMEVALKWRAAQFGDYAAKYDFVEYYLCNGPELDADTLLHYRGRAQADPVVMEIAYSYFSDPLVLSEIREKKYGKKKNNDWTDCFKNPCFYLGDFSPAMGSMGDVGNWKTYWKDFGEKFTLKFWEKNFWMRENQAKAIGADPPQKPAVNGNVVQDVVDSATGSAPIKPQDVEKPSGNPPGGSMLATKIRPSYWEGWETLGAAFAERNNEKFNQGMGIINDAHTGWLSHIKMDDWFGGAIAKTLDLVDKTNTVRQLGDCYRMWSQVRRLQIFGEDNQYGPIRSDQLVADKMTDGTARQTFAQTHPAPADTTQGINAGNVAAAQAALKGQNAGTTTQ